MSAPAIPAILAAAVHIALAPSQRRSRRSIQLPVLRCARKTSSADNSTLCCAYTCLAAAAGRSAAVAYVSHTQNAASLQFQAVI